MKRLAYVLIFCLMLCQLSGCRATVGGERAGDVSLVSEVYSVAESRVESSKAEESAPESVPSSSAPAVYSQPEPTPAPAPETASSSAPTPEPTPAPNPAPTVVAGYEVFDPENTRGLSEVGNGFGFGYASGGAPHSISVNNQARFDSLAGVQALALDTVSGDKRMYLTFDCGYEYNNLTANILDTLRAKNIKAAFFVTLSYIKNNPQLVRRMIDEGHIVGNHSATHPVFPDISRTEMAQEIYLVDQCLQNDFGYKSKYFRFPTGEYSHNALELVTSVGYKSIFWSLAYGDYDTKNQMSHENAFNTVTSRYHSGAVILLHAVSQTNADILSALIDNAHAQGYSFKTLDDYYGS